MTYWLLLFGWLPSWVQIVFLVLIAVVLVIAVIRLVSGILSALPFL